MITWKIVGMERNASDGDNSDVIVAVSWRCEALEVYEGANYIGAEFGIVTLDSPSSSFISFSDITEDTAIGWCKADLGSENVSSIEARVSAAAVKCSGQTKTTITGLPW